MNIHTADLLEMTKGIDRSPLSKLTAYLMKWIAFPLILTGVVSIFYIWYEGTSAIQSMKTAEKTVSAQVLQYYADSRGSLILRFDGTIPDGAILAANVWLQNGQRFSIRHFEIRKEDFNQTLYGVNTIFPLGFPERDVRWNVGATMWIEKNGERYPLPEIILIKSDEASFNRMEGI